MIEDYETIDWDLHYGNDYENSEDRVFHDWRSEHMPELQIEFIEKLPPEERPLDDDTPDYFDNHPDEFDAYCREEFNKREW